jgi:hypothetical protein
MCTREKAVEAYLKILTIRALGRLGKNIRRKNHNGAPAEERTRFS